ncbi:Uncharacterised protein [uncultured archaeon]|nr:Uncharacterised protein [uncultured archaeon]
MAVSRRRTFAPPDAADVEERGGRFYFRDPELQKSLDASVDDAIRGGPRRREFNEHGGFRRFRTQFGAGLTTEQEQRIYNVYRDTYLDRVKPIVDLEDAHIPGRRSVTMEEVERAARRLDERRERDVGKFRSRVEDFAQFLRTPAGMSVAGAALLALPMGVVGVSLGAATGYVIGHYVEKAVEKQGGVGSRYRVSNRERERRDWLEAHGLPEDYKPPSKFTWDNVKDVSKWGGVSAAVGLLVFGLPGIIPGAAVGLYLRHVEEQADKEASERRRRGEPYSPREPIKHEAALYVVGGMVAGGVINFPFGVFTGPFVGWYLYHRKKKREEAEAAASTP